MSKVNLLHETYLREAYNVNISLKDKLETCDMLKREIENAKVAGRVTVNITINVRKKKLGDGIGSEIGVLK